MLTCAALFVPMQIDFVGLLEAFRELNSLNLHQTFETIRGLSIDFSQYFLTAYKCYLLQMDIARSLYCTFKKNRALKTNSVQYYLYFMLTVLRQNSKCQLWIPRMFHHHLQFPAVEMLESLGPLNMYRHQQTLTTPSLIVKKTFRIAIDPSIWLTSPTSATPKSEIFNVSSSVISRFPGFISLWMTPFPCKYSKPSSSWRKYRCAWNNGIFFSGTESSISYRKFDYNRIWL